MINALYMLWTGNWRHGAFPLHSTVHRPEEGHTLAHDETLTRCGCDGQFSESDICRRYTPAKFDIPSDPRHRGLCSSLHTTPTFRFYTQTILKNIKYVLVVQILFLCHYNMALITTGLQRLLLMDTLYHASQ